MKVQDLGCGVKLISPDFELRDGRGGLYSLFEEQNFDSLCPRFVKDNLSISQRGVLRGLHGDDKTWKLVTCLRGIVWVAVVDCRPSPSFGRWVGRFLSGGHIELLLVPPMRGLGHYVCSEDALFFYKWTEPYGTEQFTYRWDDSRFNIWWPFEGQPVLSKRDANAEYV